jgi:hypothetical protein
MNYGLEQESVMTVTTVHVLCTAIISFTRINALDRRTRPLISTTIGFKEHATVILTVFYDI